MDSIRDYIDLSDERLETLARVKANQILMMLDRGYPPNESESKLISAPCLNTRIETDEPDDGDILGHFLTFIRDIMGDDEKKLALLRRPETLYTHVLNRDYRIERPGGRLTIIKIRYPTDKGKGGLSEAIGDEKSRQIPDERIYIYIFPVPPTHHVYATVRELTKTQVEIFSEDKFYNDVMGYKLQPKFTVISKEEARELLYMEDGRKRISLRNLQVMSYDDPVARWLGLKVNDIVRVERESLWLDEFQSKEITYRRVAIVPHSKKETKRASVVEASETPETADEDDEAFDGDDGFEDEDELPDDGEDELPDDGEEVFEEE